jgi:hypothetical protein
MSTIIGGPHKCNIHPDFPETDDEEEWTKHLTETEGHSTSGAFPCEICGAEIRVDNIPIQPKNNVAKLKCPDCYNNQDNLQQLVLNSVQQPQKDRGGEFGGRPNV